MEFLSLSSGSKGNCLYIGTKHTKILIDAGLSGKYVAEGLSKHHVNPFHIDAIFITHEHSDHIKGAGVLARKYDIPIFATEGTWSVMCTKIGNVLPSKCRIVYANEPCIINELTIMPFSINHDAMQPVGYSIKRDDKKIGIATDLGCFNEHIISHLEKCQLLFLEANHDIDMLKNGGYPADLKRRVLSDIGHLSNVASGELASELVWKKLKYLYLGHLSDDNNRPELAFNTVKAVLINNGVYNKKELEIIMALQGQLSKKVVI